MPLVQHPSSQLIGFAGSVEHYSHPIEMEGATMATMDEQNDEAMSFLLQEMMRHSSSPSTAPHVVHPQAESDLPSWKGYGNVPRNAQGKHTYRLRAIYFRDLSVHRHNINCAFCSTITAISVDHRSRSCKQRHDNLGKPWVRRTRERHPL